MKAVSGYTCAARLHYTDVFENFKPLYLYLGTVYLHIVDNIVGIGYFIQNARCAYNTYLILDCFHVRNGEYSDRLT